MLLKKKGQDEVPRPDHVVKPVIRTSLTPKPREQNPQVPKPTTTPVAMTSGDYKLPSIDILEDAKTTGMATDANRFIEEQSQILQDTLTDFGIDAKVVEVEQGPVITRFESHKSQVQKLK